MNELYNMLDDYRENKINGIDLETINDKQQELGVVFPDAMKLF